MTRRPDTLDLSRPALQMPSACATGGCGGGEPERPVFPSFGVVSVNGVEIDPDAIAVEIQHHPAPDAETAWREAARALAVRELLLQEAQRAGLQPAPEEDPSGRRETEDDALIHALLEREVEPQRAGMAECRQYYEANKVRFRTPDLLDAAHILVEPAAADDAAWEAARNRARDLAQMAGDDPARFGALARAHSACASAQQDGSLGQIRRGELIAEIHAALETLPEGATSREPVRSRHGWHVLRLQRRIEGQTLPFEMVRERIADMLEARSWMVSSARYIAQLAERGQVDGVDIGSDA